jgi:hypothetical protein
LVFPGDAGVITGHRVPTRDVADIRRPLEGVEQGLAVHVLAHRQAEQGEDRGRDVSQVGAVDQAVALDAGAGQQNHAEVAVLDRGGRRLLG